MFFDLCSTNHIMNPDEVNESSENTEYRPQFYFISDIFDTTELGSKYISEIFKFEQQDNVEFIEWVVPYLDITILLKKSQVDTYATEWRNMSETKTIHRNVCMSGGEWEKVEWKMICQPDYIRRIIVPGIFKEAPDR